MGILSGWFGLGSTSSAEATSSPKGPAAASKPNVWRSVFDPGSNPNIDRQGSNFYDKVHDAKGTAPTTWDMILKAQDFRRKSFSDLDRDKDGFVDAKELSLAMPPSMQGKVDTASLISQVKPGQEGKLTRKEFNEVLDKYFLA
jgi:hypothetical protein